jgi:hypothetical protein
MHFQWRFVADSGMPVTNRNHKQKEILSMEQMAENLKLLVETEKPRRGDVAARWMNTSESVFFPSLAQL